MCKAVAHAWLLVMNYSLQPNLNCCRRPRMPSSLCARRDFLCTQRARKRRPSTGHRVSRLSRRAHDPWCRCGSAKPRWFSLGQGTARPFIRGCWDRPLRSAATVRSGQRMAKQKPYRPANRGKLRSNCTEHRGPACLQGWQHRFEAAFLPLNLPPRFASHCRVQPQAPPDSS